MSCRSYPLRVASFSNLDGMALLLASAAAAAAHGFIPAKPPFDGLYHLVSFGYAGAASSSIELALVENTRVRHRSRPLIPGNRGFVVLTYSAA